MFKIGGNNFAQLIIDEATKYAKEQDEEVDYTYSNVYNVGTLSESNLVDAEKLFRDFVDDNGKPKSLFSKSHTIAGPETTYSNLGASILNGFDLDLSHTMNYAIDYGKDSKYYCYLTSADELPITPTTSNSTMYKFKRGDIVTPIVDIFDSKKRTECPKLGKMLKAGQPYTVAHRNFCLVNAEDLLKNIKDEDSWKEEKDWLYICSSENAVRNFILYSSPTPTMGVLSMARDFILGEPEASFKKAGITDGNGQFTEDTRIAFLENLMRADAKTDTGYLQTLAKAIIAKQEKDCKKC